MAEISHERHFRHQKRHFGKPQGRICASLVAILRAPHATTGAWWQQDHCRLEPSFMPDPVTQFLSNLSLEITARQRDKVPFIASRLHRGTKVFIALIDPADAAGQLEAARAVRAHGLEPVPHLPARFIKDRDDLFDRVGRFAEIAKVDHILVLGGGAPEPLGKFDAAIKLIETGVFEKNGIVRIGIAGHPEGNPDIIRRHGEAMLLQALKEKQACAKAHELEAHIATQFLFEADPLARWAATLHQEGIDLPIHVGVPGPATIKTLAKYAIMCGVGNSARFIRRQALNVSKLLTVSAPDELLVDLARLHAERPELRIAAPHFYPFGGFDRLFEWLAAKLPRPRDIPAIAAVKI
jgi:methylenetetrahydrofolate reductase (NADPH)